MRIKLVGIVTGAIGQAADPQGQEQQGQQTGQEEQADTNFQGADLHQKSPNIKAVRMKSSPSTAREA
ncbi:hypothetical protein D3C76_1832580 [compost metagenome]